MGTLVPLKVGENIYELRPAQHSNIFQILKSATVVPDGMKPRTITGTEYEPILRVEKIKATKPTGHAGQPQKMEKGKTNKKSAFGFKKNK